MGQLEVPDGTEHRPEVALLVLQDGGGELLEDECDVVVDGGVAGQHVARPQQRVLALAQLAALVVGPRQVHQHLRVVVQEELLQAVLVLCICHVTVMCTELLNILTGRAWTD